MNLLPSENLTEEQRKSGLKFIVRDGLAAEAMATLTGGAFLVALALNFGASNFQIGLLAALPTLGNIFQIAAIYLVYHYSNRRAITVYSSLFARLPLLLISFLPFLFSSSVCLNLLILLLFFHYVFGGMSGCSWNSWMKDLVPEEMLGTYFSNRSRLIQILSISLSLACAFLLDHIKTRYPVYEIPTYSVMFFIGGLCGVYGIYMLIKTPEPKIIGIKTNLLKLFKNPLKNVNFRNLLIFNSCWSFAVNLAAPFFSVYLLKMLHMKLSYVVAFSILSQLTSILFIRVWGRYSDKYSNKSILKICGPLYLACILAWTFTTMPQEHLFSIPLLVLIYIFNGISTSGINLALSNIGMKLAPREGDAIVYLTVKGMINAFFAGIAPVIGGFFADFFAIRELSWNIEWKSPTGNFVLHTLELQQWDFFFLFAFVLGIFALYRLTFVKEKGEVRKRVIMAEIFSELKSELRTNASLAGAKSMVHIPFAFYSLIKRKRRKAVEHKRKKHASPEQKEAIFSIEK
jgi:MFS family permease